jgi:hypothetical protein
MRLLDALKAKEPLTKEETIRPLISDSQSEVLFAPSFVDLLENLNCCLNLLGFYRIAFFKTKVNASKASF